MRSPTDLLLTIWLFSCKSIKCQSSFLAFGQRDTFGEPFDNQGMVSVRYLKWQFRRQHEGEQQRRRRQIRQTETVADEISAISALALNTVKRLPDATFALAHALLVESASRTQALDTGAE